MAESLKRKRGAQDFVPIEGKSSNVKPARVCSTGKDVKAAIESGSKDAIVALEKQLRVVYSQQATISLTHPSVVIIQQYLALSPKCDEVLTNWKHGNDRKNTQLVEISMQLLTTMINLLVPVPYFLPTLQNLVEKFLDTSENYGNMLTRMILSTKREHAHLGMGLAAALVHIDPGHKGSVSRINGRIWTMIADSGCLRALPKLLSMRRKGGFAAQADPLDKPDIRHLTVHFLLPFLAYPLFLSGSKPMVIPLFSNLKDDPAQTIYRVLDAIWDAINASPSSAVNRKTSVALLHENSIDGIVKLYKRDANDDEDDKVNEVSPAEMAHQFLLRTCTNPGTGVCFPDQGWYKRKGKGKADDLHMVEADLDGGDGGETQKDGSAYGTKMLHNHILGNVVRRIGARAVEEPKVAELVYSILGSCPELVASFWPHSGISVDPRLSAKWLATMALLGHVISLPLPPNDTFHVTTGITKPDGSKEMVVKASPPALQVIIEAVLPSPLSKQHLSKGLQHGVGLVQHETALTLARALQKLLLVKAAFAKFSKEVRHDMGNEHFDDPWSKALRELEMEARKRVPEVPVIIAFAQKSAASQALQASLEEADEGEKAKAVLLTESALRLFRLYYHALPNMAAEFRFDVGKLLVSSSSAKQEAAARKMAREGSVIDDSGSVASFGTVGSAGMGGGFGQSRGDVAEFDALSQVHVLELLASVREWDWTAKAAGSAYSYVYHILQLRLSTPHLRTVQVTDKLLAEMIGESIMFDHDRKEWNLWVECLPRTRALGVKTSATLALERLHLLGFVDDCIRRCMKTPYRYIEESASLVAKHPVNIDRSTWPSPLLLTMFEQFQAKLAGHHIAADAAEVVLAYLRNVVLAMTAKQSDLAFIQLLKGRLQTCLSAAELKRETALPSLSTQLAVLAMQLDAFAGRPSAAVAESVTKDVEGEDEAENVRRRVLNAPPGTSSSVWNVLLNGNLKPDTVAQLVSVTPFPVLLADLNEDMDLSAAFALLRQACMSSSSARLRSLQYACILNRLTGFNGTTCLIGHAIELLVVYLEVDGSKPSTNKSTKIRQLVATPAIQAVMMNRDQRIRKNLVFVLRNASPLDSAVITEVAEHLGALFLGMSDDEQIAHSRAFATWVRYLPRSLVEKIFVSFTNGSRRDRDSLHLLAKLLQGNKSVTLVLSYLKFILAHKLQLPALEGTRSLGTFTRTSGSLSGREMEDATRGDAINAEFDLAGINLASLSTSALQLVAFCSSCSRDGPIRVTNAMVQVNWTSGSLRRLRSLYQEVDLEAIESSRPGFVSLVTESALADTAADADSFLTKVRPVLLDRASFDKRLAGSILGLLRENSIAFTQVKIQLLHDLSAMAPGTFSVKSVLEGVVQWLTPRLTSDVPLSEKELCATETLDHLVRSVELEVAAHLVEPLLAAVIQGRLHDPAVVALAAALCEKSPIKAMVVRQHLQLLLNPDKLNKAMKHDPVRARRSVATIALALFNSSPYSACQVSFIEPLIRLYKGSLDPADIELMAICGLYERYKRTSLSRAIVALWTPQMNMAADENETALEAIKQLDPKIVFATCIAFERKSLRPEHNTVYDARFVLSLVAACLREGPLTGLQWVEMLRSNVLALATCALSSKFSDVRHMAGTVLAAAVEMVQTTPFQEQSALRRLLSLLRHGVTTGEDGTIDRVPFMMALFFAHAFRTIGEPSSYLYPLVSAFLLRRPIMDFKDVPMLYDLLYAAGQGSKRERRWMVRFIRDSVRSRSDWQICKRRHTFALLASIFQSTTEYNLRTLIIQALQSMTAVPEASIHLAEKEGLIEWLEMACLDDTGKGVALEDIMIILENTVSALVSRDMSKSNKIFERERRWHIQILGYISRIAPVRDFVILRRLSEMVLRISLTTRSAIATQALVVLTDNLRDLDLGDATVLHQQDWRTTVESLLRAGMAWDPDTLNPSEKTKAAQSLSLLSCRVAACPGPLGDWLRKEAKALAGPSI